MKKLVLLSLVVFALNGLNASIVTPTGEDVLITVDINSSQISVKQLATSEQINVVTVEQLKTVVESLPTGQYELEYKLDGTRNKINFNITQN